MSNMLSDKLAELQVSFEDSVYVAPNIPAKKIQNSLKSYGAPSMKPEEIIILVDDTLFGSAKSGIIITNEKICVKSSFCVPVIIDFENIKKISHNGSKLFINNQEIIDLCNPKDNVCERLYKFLEKNINKDNNLENSIMDENKISIYQNNEQEMNIIQLESDAINGDIDSQYKLGKYYYEKKDTKGFLNKSFYWFDKLAENGDADMQYDIAIFYDSSGYEDKAFYWYKRSAENGNKEAQLDVGLAFMLGNGTEPDDCEGHKWFKKAADNGNIEAMWSLGKSYLDGDGTAQDLKKAFYWFRKGAENGDSMAQNSLGICYLRGRGTEIDEKKGFYWVKQSAEQGEKIAQGNLGDYYRKGIGTPVDLKKAQFWYQKAAAQGDKYSKEALSKYFSPTVNETVLRVAQDNCEANNVQPSILQSSAEVQLSSSEISVSLSSEAAPKVNRLRTNSKFSDDLFKPIARLDGYAIVIVALIKNNAADKILDIISKFPGIGIIGIMGKVVLNKPSQWLTDQFIEYGEQFIMGRLIDSWRERGITFDALLNKIESIPSFLLDEKVINDSKILLNKYYD